MQGNMKKTDVWTNTPIHSRRNRKFPELDKGEKKKRTRTKGVTIEKDPQYGVITRMKLQTCLKASGARFIRYSMVNVIHDMNL